MRLLGFALVAVSVVFTSGGVVYRRTAHAEQPAATAAPEGRQDEMCRADSTPNSVETGVRRTRLAAEPGAQQVIVLGSTGFNYSRPGDASPTRVRVGDAPPAAPAD